MSRERPRLWRRPRLSRQILLLQLAIIVLTLGTGVGVSILQARKQLDRGSGRQSLAIARTVAQLPEIHRAFALPHPERAIQPIAERIRKANGASFVVVANDRGIRYVAPRSREGRPTAVDGSIGGPARARVRRRTDRLAGDVRASEGADPRRGRARDRP